MLFRKTPTKERKSYKYHFADGKVSEIRPEEVGEDLIRILHAADDAEVYNNIKNSRAVKAQGNQKNWNLSMDGLTQTEDKDHSRYMGQVAVQEPEDPQRELLYEQVQLLPEQDQRIYYLYYVLQKTQQEIAAELGVTQKTVSLRKSALEKKLKDYFFGRV